ncbi:uncharacterized protein LOC109503938 [Harpegnathos saltator]|uniref:uncharacterized protein LOC109503938 n=1 Tax=Harpegnathos saltator TaxID=610380 RepID=UPI000948A9A1|nr:uncharacterized protein LOC109503938 [Harpegnathos saltator]
MYPCYLCMFDIDRKNHYIKKQWPARSSLEPGSGNIVHQPLIEPSKILLPPLHIKLGLMKQFVKALNKGQMFRIFRTSNVSKAKLKDGIFDGPQIRKLFRDENFVTTMNEQEKVAWLSFKNVATKFLGNNKDEDYKRIIENMIENFQKLGCLMNLKLQFLDFHLDSFTENLGDCSEEQGERFHQDMKEIERRYQGRWDINIMADFCWMLKRKTRTKGQKRHRNPLHKSFEDKRERRRKPI